jgi:hypothetical protein
LLIALTASFVVSQSPWAFFPSQALMLVAFAFVASA